MRALLTILFAVSLAHAAAAQQFLAVTYGGAETSNFGTAVAMGGDFDGDGFSDVLVGTPLFSSEGLLHRGRVDVISGKNGLKIHTELGGFEGDQLGASVCFLGDVDADGKSDFAAGAPFSKALGGLQTGSVLLVTTHIAKNSVFGQSGGDRFGAAIAYGGPHRLVVGAPFRDHGAGDEGSAYQYTLFVPGDPSFGIQASKEHEWTGSQQYEHLGAAVAGGEDVDGDGMADVVAAAPDHDFLFPPLTDAGQVRVLSGKSPYSTIALKSGAATGAHFGFSVALLHDADGDGRADYLVGAPYQLGFSAGAGVVFLYSGATGSLVIQRNGSGVNAHFGWAVTAVGDVNGDGKTDYAVGVPEADVGGTDSGEVFVFGTGQLPLQIVNGDAAGDRFGASLGGGGDANADGHPDYAVGAPNSDVLAAGSGSVEIRSGASNAALKTITGPIAGTSLGVSVAGVGDVDGDGWPDYALGAPFTDAVVTIAPPFVFTFPDAGAVRIHSGKTALLIREDDGAAAGDQFGTKIAALGDVDGDGRPDYAALALGSSTFGSSSIVIRSGATGAVIRTIAVAPFVPDAALAGAGDLDLDGVPDVVFGNSHVSLMSSGADGEAWAFSGATGATLWLRQAEAAFDSFGYSAASAGDVDGDGVPDVLVGAPHVGGGHGRGYVLAGGSGSTLRTHDGTGTGQVVGGSSMGLGDVNGDGKSDYVFSGVPSVKGFRAYSGSNGVVLYTVQVDGVSFIGSAYAPIGDVDLDGATDFAVAVGQLGGNAPPWSVQLRSGATGEIIEEFSGINADQNFGSALAGVGDVNHDGLPDMIVGAPEELHGVVTAVPPVGAAYLYTLRPKGVTFYGASSPGCAGAELLSTNGVPTHGSATFEYRCSKTPPSSLGLLLATNVADLAGSDPFGFGIDLHVDLFASTLLVGLDMPTNAAGFGKTPLAIPSSPGLIGTQIFLQVIFAWSSGCALPPFGLSASEGLQITIQ